MIQLDQDSGELTHGFVGTSLHDGIDVVLHIVGIC